MTVSRNVKGCLFAVVAWVVAAPVPSALAATLHAVFIGDTEDPHIGVGVETDLNKAVRTVTRIAEATGLELDDVVIKGVQFRRANLDRAMAQLRVAADDVVILLYSGHGKGASTKDTPWPLLALKTADSGYDPVDVADIVDGFHRLKPRLLVAIIDACNNYDANAVGADNDREAAIPQLTASPGSAANLKKLFLGQSGVIVAAAASPNEFAAGPVTGGLLINGFLRALSHHAAGAAAADWGPIMDAATQKVERRLPSGRVERQAPFYRMDVVRVVADAASRKDLTTTPNLPAAAASPPAPPSVRSEMILHVERRVVVRDAPSGGAGEIRVLTSGEAVSGRLSDAGNNWYRLEASEGWSGYVFGRPFRQ